MCTYFTKTEQKLVNAAIEGEEGYALWSDRLITEKVNNATRNLPKTEGPSHFVLTAHEILPNVCPNQKEGSKIRVGAFIIAFLWEGGGIGSSDENEK